MRESVIYQEILEEGEAKGIAKGEAKGEARGKAETARKIALNLLGIGMSLEQVAQVTELSIEQVRVLQQEMI
jgi:predicted transposase/invertase (TIGR01784 family)